ncbi:O-antigen ligase family protein [Cognatitamlana onchidii]|uniref:O-antigen ligase family protein n=1 Tax=Cognatitamlana onchidii TaxID=2562860 RepID=UPI0010A6663B|nr:O-antigen ligase family protein [Algibacter onchidii]
MMKEVDNRVDDYYYPIFIFLVIITGYWDSPLRKVISMIFPIMLITFFLVKFRFTVKINFTTLLIYLYIFICVIASIYAYDKANSFFITFRIIIFFLLISGLYLWMDNYYRFQLIVKSIIYAGIVVCGSIYLAVLLGNVQHESNGSIRTGGIFSNINSAGFICYISCAYSYFKFIEKKKSRFVFLMLFFVGGIIITGSRASMLALAVSFLFYNLRFKLTKKVISLLFLGLISLSGVLFFFKDKILTMLRLDKGLSARDVLFNIGINITKDHPYTGIGLGNLKDIGAIYIEKEDVGNWLKNMLLDIGIQSSHNVFIETAAEIGVFGSGILALILLHIGRKYYKGLKVSLLKDRNFYFIIWGIFMGILVRCFFESNGIINRGWITIDIFFWITYVIFLRSKQWKLQKSI